MPEDQAQNGHMPPVPKPASLDPAIQQLGEIDDVDVDAEKYLKIKYKKQVAVGAVVFVAAEALWFGFLYYTHNISEATIYAGFIPVAIAIAFLMAATFSRES